MGMDKMRRELAAYYYHGTEERAEAFCAKAHEIMNARYRDGMSVYEQKVLQYQVITEMFEPVLFYTSPYYYETGTMWAQTDGSRFLRGHRHAASWVYYRNCHQFEEQDAENWQAHQALRKELFYTVCGPFNDVTQHFNFDTRPVLAIGLKGLYEKAKAGLAEATEDEEKQYLSATMAAMCCLKKMAEKYAQKAEEMMQTAPDEAARKNMAMIYEAARRTPWEPPQTLYEAINTYAFMRKALGALEGVGPNTFGRLDMDLYPYYVQDLQNGTITAEEAYELVCKFLLTWDLHYDHEAVWSGYSDYELENTYVLGGCDADGKPLYNELTEMFLRATREEKIIFPKITCRYASDSPKAYLDAINKAVVDGTSTVLYQNDEATIPSLLRYGKTLAEARDYLITGCWAITGNGVEKMDDGCYVNLLRPFEYVIHNRQDMMRQVGLQFDLIDEAQSFDEVYRIMLENIMRLFRARAEIVAKGANIWNRVDPLPIFSSTLQDCIAKKKDYTAGGAKYRESRYELVGFPTIVDSLLAIRELCFEQKKYTLQELLTAVRCNFEGYESLRQDAIRCHGWGDGSEVANTLAERFNKDLFERADTLVGSYGGKIVIGHLTYTEIRFWGEKTLATPDGRKSGDYLAQGLTPSRLKKISSVTNVIDALKHIDGSRVGGNSVVNIILPNRISLDACEAFLRAASKSGLQSLQLNCTTKEQLLDAQKHPEEYPHLIVRVCGFSAKFTSLSPEWQQEIITRNFYD